MIDIIDRFQLYIRLCEGEKELVQGKEGSLLISQLEDFGNSISKQEVILQKKDIRTLYLTLHEYYTRGD
jgi:hypothetical protein